MRPILAAVLLLGLFALSHAQLYDVYIVRADDGATIASLVYDDDSWSYADNSMENPDVSVRVCTSNPADLLNKWVALAYADGSDGDYIEVSAWPLQVTSVAPNGCAVVPLDISSFKAWYPSIPYVFIANDASLAGASRWKLSRLRGWMIGDYTLTSVQTGNDVDVTVTSAIDDLGASIVPDVPYLVVGLTRPDFTTMDTVITSLNELETLVSDGGNYSIFINGIGPDVPPYVEIFTPQPITYTTQIIPFTYIIIDDEGVSACWYVLDGTTVEMPDCISSYILNVGPGTHTLTLYANDTLGQIGSDSVTFTVSTVAPPYVPPAGGGTKTPYHPTVPPSFPTFFSIAPEDIRVVVDYPLEGRADFTVYSNTYMTELVCEVVSDFGQYTSVELDSDVIQAEGTVSGTITVSMAPEEILDYSQGMSGYLQCTARLNPSTRPSTLANVYLVINRPILGMDNQTYSLMPGELLNGTVPVWNIGPGNATAINITAEASGVDYEVSIDALPDRLGPGEHGLMGFSASIPADAPEGVGTIEVRFYENGRLVGTGYLMVRVLPGPPLPPPYVCVVPDLTWTIAILLLAVLSGIIIFRKKVEGEKDAGERTAERKYQYKSQA